MSNDSAVALAAISLCGALATGFFRLLNRLERALDKNTKSNEKLADVSKKGHNRVAVAVENQAKESAERNGHLGEMIIQQGKITQKIADTAVKQIMGAQEIKEQHVKEQVVDHQTIEDKG